ncbi:MAG: DUF882 domain-containing protein [Ruminococcaceae bacterium]|nr:DUF882 domain-containing protein [Oscillospiraceae bacterium]
MLQKYSLKKDGNIKLSKNFKVCEFACKDGSDTILISSDLVELLQKIRDHFGKPITINSAYRNATYNKKIGGATYSQHVQGTAADIVVKDITPKEIAQYAEYLMPKIGGIGLYSSFVHIDVRQNRARWENYGTEKGVSGFPGYEEDLTIDNAVNILVENGIISEPIKWKSSAAWSKENVTCLIIKMAEYIRRL